MSQIGLDSAADSGGSRMRVLIVGCAENDQSEGFVRDCEWVCESAAARHGARPRIAIACFTGDSGLTDYSVSLARELCNQVDVTLYTSNSIDARFERMGFAVSKVFRRSRHYMIDFSRFLFRLLVEMPAAILFQSQLKFPALEGIAVKMLQAVGVRVALTVHDILPHYPRPWSRYQFRWFYRRFDRLVVHSSAAETMLRALGVETPILVVPHGTYDLFRVSELTPEQARRRLGIENDQFVALFFGHLEPRKGLIEFLGTARNMADRSDFSFVVAGSNDLARHGAAYVDALESAKALRNTIVRDERIPFEEVEAYFLASDVVVLPYLEGTTSGVLKLAIAFGVPVIATRVGDLPEEVPKGGGVFIDVGNRMCESLAEALQEVASDHRKLRAGMQQARANCEWSAIAKRYLEFLLN